LNNEVFLAGDNKIVYKYNSSENDNIKFMEFEDYPTDLDWLPITKGVNEVFAIGFSDGSF